MTAMGATCAAVVRCAEARNRQASCHRLERESETASPRPSEEVSDSGVRRSTVESASGRRVRLDYLTEVGGRIVGTEVKNGPTARLSTRQKEIFAELEAHGGRFVGGNAGRAGLSGRLPAGTIRRDFRGR